MEGRPPKPSEKRRWYDRKKDDKWAQHVSEDPWKQHIVDQLDELRRALFIRYIILVVLLAGVGAWAIHTSSQVSTNQSLNTKALCDLRDDLQKRVDQGEALLKAHPNGIAGISPAAIRITISGQQSTLSALQILQCPLPPKPKSK